MIQNKDSTEKNGKNQQVGRDTLPTPLRSGAMRRDYGSLLPDLIDAPLNDATLLQAYAASIMAIIRWEPRIRVTAVRRQVSTAQPGAADAAFHARIAPDRLLFAMGRMNPESLR